MVCFDRPRLGALEGVRGVHLQCHIGTDTLSLARLGAQMTGLDFSPASIAEARTLAQQTGTPVEYVEADVYRALEVLPRASFDLVYTGVGALCWLPDIARWADVVGGLLRPDGRLFIREGHPMLFAIDESHKDRLVVDYPYFQTDEPLVIEDAGTYVETEVQFSHNLTHEWNHGLGETVTALARGRNGDHKPRRARQRPLGGDSRSDERGCRRRMAAQRPALAPCGELHVAGSQTLSR